MLRQLLRGVAQTMRGAPRDTERNGPRRDLGVDAICDLCAHRYRWHGRTCTHDTVQLRGDCPCPGFTPSGFRSIAWPGLLPATLLPEELCAACEHRYTFHDLELAIAVYDGRRSLLESNSMSCHYDDPALMIGCECKGWSRSGRVGERSALEDGPR